MRFSREKFLAAAILLLVLVVTAAGLWPELSISRVDLNDNVFHLTLVERIAHAVEAGENPLDCWSAEWSLGYPVLRTYQPLAHWLVVGIWLLLAKSVSLVTVFVAVRFLSVVLLPLSFFAAARLLGLPYLTAAAASLLAPLVSTDFLYGVENGSFTWAGSGLFPQAVATHLLLLSIGIGWRALRGGRRLALAGGLVGLTVLAHLIYGYMAAMSLFLLAVIPLPDSSRAVRLRRLVAAGAGAFALSAFQIIPLLRDAAWINHSRWEPVWKWDSFGAAAALTRLFTGELLDHGRLPLLTVLALAGATLWLWDRRAGRVDPVHSYIGFAALLWMLVWFGRPFWGPLLALAGISEDMHLHRVLGGAQIFLLLLAAIALARLWNLLADRRQALVALAVTALLLYPMAADRARNLSLNAQWGRRNLQQYAAARPAIDVAVARAKQAGGRAYAGLAATWGGAFKVGDVPFYAFLSTARVPAVGFLYHSMALTGDVMVRFNDLSPAHYRLFNIRSVVMPETIIPPALLTPRAQAGSFRVFDAPGGGYFDLVDASAAVRVTRDNFYDVNDRWLQSNWPSQHAHLLLELRDPAPPGVTRIASDAPLPILASAAPSAGDVLAERQYGPQSFAAECHLFRPVYALFKMTWHPNWKAYVDGTPQPVTLLSPGFSAVLLPPGRHRVEFRYEPGWSKPFFAALGLLLLVAGGTAGSRFTAVVPSLSLPPRVAVAAGVAALALPVAIPLFSSRLLWGHDALEYFPRVLEVHRNLVHGILLPRWAPDFARGAGQPLFIFHPPLFYWLGELWHLTGFEPVTAVNLAAALIVFASVYAMYFLGRLYFGRTGGLLAAAAYLYAPYFAVDLYVRSAMEEYTAFPLIALSLYGFGAYARYGDRRKWLLGAASFAAVLFCHFPAALLFAALLAAFLALTAWMARSWRIAAMQAAGFALALALAAWSWVPALLERQYVALNRTLEGHARYTNHFVYLQQLVHSPWGYGLSVPGPVDGMSFTLGWAHLLLAVVAFVWAGKQTQFPLRPLVRFCAAAVAVLAFLMCAESVFLWEVLPLLPYIEYPWRMLQPAALCLALLVAALGPAIDNLPRHRALVTAAVLALLIVPGLSHLRPGRSVDVDPALWTPAHIASSGFETTTMGEITPIWSTAQPPTSPNIASITVGQAGIAEQFSSPFEWSGHVRASTGATVQLSRAYFPGWNVHVDGRSVVAGAAPLTGLLQFPVAAGEHEVYVKWGRSRARSLGEAISIVGCILAVLVLRRRSRPAQEKTETDI